MLFDSVLLKISIVLGGFYIFALCLKNIKLFILVYIALRSLIAVFYDVKIMGGLNILEFLGFFFPVILIFYWVKTEKFRFMISKQAKIYSIVMFWILFSNLTSIIKYGFHGIYSFSNFFRILNGYVVFMVFPLIFKDIKDVDRLINAFLITTIFPLLQGFLQIAGGRNFLGMGTNITKGDQADFVMYYGLYYKYEWYAWAALLGGLLLIYKIGKTSSFKRAPMGKEIFYIILFIFFITLGAVTLSRALFISLFIISIFIFFNLKKNYKIAFLVLIGLFVTGGFFKGQLGQLLLRSDSEIKVMKGELPADYGFHGRISLWQRKLGDFNSQSLLNRFTGTKIGVGPHSDYFQWLFSYGYVGLFLYLYWVIVLFMGCISKIKRIDKATVYLPYGQMVTAGLIIWVIEAIIHNPSVYLDYLYMIIGNTGIFMNLSAVNSKNIKRNTPLHEKPLL